MQDPQWCGCCGRQRKGHDDNFCEECLLHVRSAGAPWDRTYFAQFNEDCPLRDPR